MATLARGACLVALILLFTGPTLAINPDDYHDTLTVINLMRRHFNSDCVSIMRPNAHLMQRREVAVHRALSNAEIATSHLDARMLELVTQQDVRNLCNRPLHVCLPGSGFTSFDLVELFKTVKISGRIWLFFVQDNDTMTTVFDGVDIPFDCQFFAAQSVKKTVVIRELYRISPKMPLVIGPYARWLHRGGLVKDVKVGFYKRRGRLSGLVLKATVNQRPPMTMVQMQNNGTVHRGFSGSVWSILMERMNFTTINSVPADRKSGNPLPNGEWSGMIGEVMQGNVDVISAGISMTSPRAAVVALSFPLSYSMIRIFIKRPEGREVNLTDFLSPFSTSLWLGLFFMVITTGAILAIMVYVMREVETAEGEPYTLYESIFIVFGAVFCQQGQAGTPESGSCRLIFFISYMVGVIAISAYSATVVSTVTVFRPQMPFRSLEDLLKDKTYTIGMVNNTFYYTMTKRAEEGVLRDLYEKFVMNPKFNPPSNYDGLERVCKESKFAFITEEETYYYLSNRLSCDLIYLPVFFVKNSMSLAFPKDSPYVGVFNSNILKLKSSGVLAILYDAYVLIKIPIRDQMASSVSLMAVLPLLGILGGGALLALATMGLERLLAKYAGRWQNINTMSKNFKLNNFKKKTTKATYPRNKDFARLTRKVRKYHNVRNGFFTGLEDLKRSTGTLLSNRRRQKIWDMRD